jgi:hypothetical protein
VVFVEVNNVGGEAIGAARFLLPEEGAWAGQARPAKERLVKDLAGPLGRWTFLLAPGGPDREAAVAAFVDPPALRVAVQAGARGEGFVQEEGCYALRAKAGRCLFTIPARRPPLVDPVFRVKGAWRGDVHVSSDGRAIRDVARLADGSVLLRVPGRIERDAAVEVVGEVPPLAE